MRAAVKASILFAFGRIPGGARLYREITRNVMGTQATHVDKLMGVWPGYLRLWCGAPCGITMEGLRVWVHEAGWTPYACLANYLTTGSGGIATNTEGRIINRYVARAVNGVLDTAWPEGAVPEGRREIVEPLRWETDAAAVLAAVGGSSPTMVSRTAVPIESESVDLCHSGGALEHYRPTELAEFLTECFRSLRPGGIASHVLDHRDHLYHADKGRGFLEHLAMSDVSYGFAYGHPLTYHNRLLPGEVMELMEAAGFEKLAVRRMILPNRKYVPDEQTVEGLQGIARERLAPRFRKATDADLHTAAAHYLYRKPAAAA